MVSGLRGYLLTNEIFFIQTYDSATIENEQILRELSTLVPAKSDQKILLDDIYQLHKYWKTEFAAPLLEAKKVIMLTDSGHSTFNKLYRDQIAKGLETDVQRSLHQKFSEFVNVEYGFRDSQKKLLNESVSITKSVTFTLTAISVVAGMFIAMFIARYISSRILTMVNMANSIAEGYYNAHMQDTGKSELSQLGKTLNHMAYILLQNISQLKRQRDQLDQFAHIVSHDIKAPLRGIDNVVTWIEEDHSFALPTKVNEYLHLIKRRLKRTESLLNGLLRYAKIGKHEAEVELIDVNELIDEIREYLPKRPGIELRVQPNLPILRSERLPLLQIFANLITNAVKYHDKESGHVKVYHKVARDHYQFFVEDNGPGIDKHHHEKIFVIFQTLDERHGEESTGVGLAIVKKILGDRSLDIKVVSESDKGSVFSFTWPKK